MKTEGKRMRGWVYVMTNASLDGKVKVGYSMKDPNLRATEAFDPAGLPDDYALSYCALVEGPRDVEAAAHRLLERFHYRKEWFSASEAEAIRAVRDAAKQGGGGILFEEGLLNVKPAVSCGGPYGTPQSRPIPPIEEYYGWDKGSKAWVLRGRWRELEYRWVISVAEYSATSSRWQTWETDTKESLRDHCSKRGLEFEVMPPGLLNLECD